MSDEKMIYDCAIRICKKAISELMTDKVDEMVKYVIFNGGWTNKVEARYEVFDWWKVKLEEIKNFLAVKNDDDKSIPKVCDRENVIVDDRYCFSWLFKNLISMSQ